MIQAPLTSHLHSPYTSQIPCKSLQFSGWKMVESQGKTRPPPTFLSHSPHKSHVSKYPCRFHLVPFPLNCLPVPCTTSLQTPLAPPPFPSGGIAHPLVGDESRTDFVSISDEWRVRSECNETSITIDWTHCIKRGNYKACNVQTSAL